MSGLGGKVLDHTALLDLAGGKTIYGMATLVTAIEQGVVLVIPSQCLVAASLVATDETADALDTILRMPVLVVDQAQLADTRVIARLMARRNAEQTVESLAFAHAVVGARRRGWPVMTRDAGFLLALDPDMITESLP